MGSETVNIPSLGELLFSLNGVVRAVAKQRPRTGKSGHFYTPKRTRDYERAVRDMAEATGGKAAACPVHLEVAIVHKVPQSWPEWKRVAGMANWIFPSKGDLDNKVKAISDALNGIAFLDDVQVCKLTSEMRYGSQEHISVRVYRAGYTLDEARTLYDYDSGGGA